MSNNTFLEQNKILADKKLYTEIPILKQNNHFQINQIQTKNDQSNSILNEYILKSTSSYQKENIQEEICFKILKLCKICSQYIQVDEFDEHLYKCQTSYLKLNESEVNIQDQSTLIILNSGEINKNYQDSKKVEEEVDKELVQIGYSVGGTEIQTIIKKDSKTGFTVYKTTYTKNQNKNALKTEQQINTEQLNINLPNTNTQNEQFNQNIDCYQTPQSEICPLCNKQYELFEETKNFECHHLFHLSCLQSLICPICTQNQQQQK
ncbi:unnamed protein product [Paramecium sonneborni]|uniref:RING-type domain-containing protein n=1 Tax=Paramecium sonneborni TaxID=65129 RepID=A0A8S1MS16_9CILI|nr:unnamed protein product [Paramecium sonneborni]